jgi:hypothetical protein
MSLKCTRYSGCFAKYFERKNGVSARVGKLAHHSVNHSTVEITRAISADLTGHSLCNRAKQSNYGRLTLRSRCPGMPLSSPTRETFQSLASRIQHCFGISVAKLLGLFLTRPLLSCGSHSSDNCLLKGA